MNFGIMFFTNAQSNQVDDPYRLVIEATKFADIQGFCSVWIPERHFHQFGGLFPNPAVLGAALAMVTKRLQIRAGSLISPLHDSIRIAEEWSVVDNLSGGRIALSFGAGWNINDFIFFPERYAERQTIMYRQIEEVRTLWRKDRFLRKNSQGSNVVVEIYPPPIQEELPIWITSSGNVDTFVKAGHIGANILTHLTGQSKEQLGEKIDRYRQARQQSGFDPKEGAVSLMLHTFLGTDVDAVKARVRQPFREYLRSAISLENLAAEGGGVISGGKKISPLNPQAISPEAMEDLLELTFERYFENASLLGTPESCEQLIWELDELGVTEIACLIDFIEDIPAVLESLEHLDRLRSSFTTEALAKRARESVDSFLEELDA